MAHKPITVVYVNGSVEEEWEVPVDTSVSVEQMLDGKDDLIKVLRQAGANLPDNRDYTLDLTGSLDDVKLRLKSTEQGLFGLPRKKG